MPKRSVTFVLNTHNPAVRALHKLGKGKYLRLILGKTKRATLLPLS